MKKHVVFLSLCVLISTLIGCSGSSSSASGTTPTVVNAVATPPTISVVTAH